MGNSILQHLVKAKSGLMLLENFESVDFMTDQGWTLLNGVPKITNTVAYSELHSLLMDLTYPQIQRAFTGNYQWAAGYFLDDSTQTVTTFKPFIEFVALGPLRRFGLGVDNVTIPGSYTKEVVNVNSATAVARTTGWHKFEFLYDGTTVTLKIDGTVVSTTVLGGLNFTQIRVGCQTYVGATAFGYFDLIQVTSSSDFVVTGLPVSGPFSNGSACSLYNADGTLLVGPGSTFGTFTVNLPALTAQQPTTLSFAATKPDGINPLFRSPNLTFCAGDVWVYNKFDLGRRVPTFRKSRPAMRSDLEASSGINQSLFYFSRDLVSMTFTSLTDDQAQDLQRWWGFAKDGSIFSAAIDEDQVYLGTVAVDTGASPASFTVSSAVGANRLEKLMLIKLNGQTFEVATVKTIAGAVITTQKPLLENYPVGSQVRSSYYWPFCISTDMNFEASLINPKLKLWNCTINFKEAL